MLSFIRSVVYILHLALIGFIGLCTLLFIAELIYVGFTLEAWSCIVLILGAAAVIALLQLFVYGLEVLCDKIEERKFINGIF